MRRLKHIQWLGWAMVGLGALLCVGPLTFYSGQRWAFQEVQKALALDVREAALLRHTIRLAVHVAVAGGAWTAMCGMGLLYETRKLRAEMGASLAAETKDGGEGSSGRVGRWGLMGVGVGLILLAVNAWQLGELVNRKQELRLWSNHAGAARAAEMLAKGRPLWLRPTPDASRRLERVGTSNGLPVKLWPCHSEWDRLFVRAFNARIARSVTNAAGR